MTELPPDFIHEAPQDLDTEPPSLEQMLLAFGVTILTVIVSMVAIKLAPSGGFTTQKRQYFAPINSRKIGDVVDINSTTPYTAMQLNRKG